MYEFVQTETGWRVFWGIDPAPSVPQAEKDNVSTKPEQEPCLLPFPQPEQQLYDWPAA